MTRLPFRLDARPALAVALPMLLAACAGTPEPTAQLGASREAIAAAERAGALEFAPVELQSARDKQSAAVEAVRDDEETRARRLAEQAQVDAELATVRAQRQLAQRAEGSVRGAITGPMAGSSGSTVPPSATGSAGTGPTTGTAPTTRGGAWGRAATEPY